MHVLISILTHSSMMPLCAAVFLSVFMSVCLSVLANLVEMVKVYDFPIILFLCSSLQQISADLLYFCENSGNDNNFRKMCSRGLANFGPPCSFPCL